MNVSRSKSKQVIDDRYRSAYRGTVLANWTGA